MYIHIKPQAPYAQFLCTRCMQMMANDGNIIPKLQSRRRGENIPSPALSVWMLFYN